MEVEDGCDHKLSVLDRGKLPSPRGPPRHQRTELEGRDPPVSGESPAPIQNQPAAVRGPRKPAVVLGPRKPAGREYGEPAGGSYWQACRSLLTQAQCQLLDSALLCPLLDSALLCPLLGSALEAHDYVLICDLINVWQIAGVILISRFRFDM